MQKKSKNWLKILLVILIPIAALVTLLIVLSGCDKSNEPEDENKQGINQTDTTNFRYRNNDYTIKGRILSTQDILTLNDREEYIEITEQFLTDGLNVDDYKQMFNDIIYSNVYDYLDKKWGSENYLEKKYSYDEEQLYIQVQYFLYKIDQRRKLIYNLY